MYAVEFKASIKNGVVHIPKKYKELQQDIDANFIVMYDRTTDKQLVQLQENSMAKTWDNDKDKAWDEL